MEFDPKTLVKTPAFAIAGGFVLGAAVFELIRGAINHLIVPFFSIVGDGGGIRIGDSIYIGCGGFIGAVMVFVVATAVGVLMIRVAAKD
ncbi:MAG: hypothetical protein HY716_12115 [Planctomycetes bacterium]|nr:hypothetical protein [Planctomycetota bacterium]